jgi:hypothetical protein
MSKQVPLVSKPAEQSGVDLQPFVEEAYVARWLAALHRKLGGVVTTRRVGRASSARVTAAPEAKRMGYTKYSCLRAVGCRDARWGRLVLECCD